MKLVDAHSPNTAKAEIAKLVGVLAAAYTYATISSPTLKVYVELLSDIPLPVLDAAIQQCVAECQFFPSIATIRAMARSLTSTVETLPSSWEAWGEVKREIDRVGRYRKPNFSTDLIEQTVRIMGWQNLCMSENQVADRAHFTKIFEQLVAKAKYDESLLPQAKKLRQFRKSSMHDCDQSIAGPLEELPQGRDFSSGSNLSGEAHD